jgi:hypothetical protein
MVNDPQAVAQATNAAMRLHERGKDARA